MTLNALHIERLKRFDDLQVELRTLTVLAGRNGSGKSTVLQAIRLYREAVAGKPAGDIWLNEEGLLLGTFDEILCNSSDLERKDNFVVSLGSSLGHSSTVEFSASQESDECEFVKATFALPVQVGFSGVWGFIYLSAERQGPRLHQADMSAKRDEKPGLGVSGQFAAEILADNPAMRVHESMVHPTLRSSTSAPNALLLSNLERWLGSIVGPIGIRATKPIRLGNPILEFKGAAASDEWLFPTNHGFGVSYALPVVLAGLLMESDAVLIVDSPEAHLHPAAQTAMALFLAHVASTGRTVLVETHSDHLLDGFRLAIADPAHALSSESCIFHYFDSSDDGAPEHVAISPRPDGTLPRWPTGCFDQGAINLRELGRLARDR